MKMKSTPETNPGTAATADSRTPRHRRHFDAAFRKHAVSLINSGRSVAEVSRQLDVSVYSLYEWKRKFRRQVDLSAPLPDTRRPDFFCNRF